MHDRFCVHNNERKNTRSNSFVFLDIWKYMKFGKTMITITHTCTLFATDKGLFGWYRKGKVASLFLAFKNSANFTYNHEAKIQKPRLRKILGFVNTKFVWKFWVSYRHWLHLWQLVNLLIFITFCSFSQSLANDWKKLRLSRNEWKIQQKEIDIRIYITDHQI